MKIYVKNILSRGNLVVVKFGNRLGKFEDLEVV